MNLRQTRVVTVLESSNPDFVRDVRNYTHSLGWSETEFVDRLLTQLALYEGSFVDADGNDAPVDLNTDCLEADTDDLDDAQAVHVEAAHQERLRVRCRDTFCKPCPPNMRPHVRVEALEMFLLVATILKAVDPAVAQNWGKRSVQTARSQEDTARHLRAHGRRMGRASSPRAQKAMRSVYYRTGSG